jgi:hypothetical protein
VAGLTLDAGALIAAERGDRRFWALWERAEQRDVDVTIPANALAQAYRGSRSAVVSKLVRACVVDPVDERVARRVGEVCARSGVADIVDVSVVVSAAARRDRIVTTDPRDLARIADHVRGVAGLIVL